MAKKTSHHHLDERTLKGITLVILYPFVVFFMGCALNLLVFDINPGVVALPSLACLQSLTLAALLLTINHSWLMTTTELTRARFKLFATPEEWMASGTKAKDASPEGLRELQRHHNAHRNATENTICFALLAIAFTFTSPSSSAAYTWIIGFAVARMGHAYSYLRGRDGLRGIFMTLSLLAMYGLASHLLLSFF